MSADNHTCGVVTGGDVYCWGSNSGGQLGDGTNEGRLKPMEVGLSRQVELLSTGSWHNCALMVDGGIKCWGRNESGQLGDGTTMNHSTPVDVLGLTSRVVSVSAGYAHTCAVTTDGQVLCWGHNIKGKLGTLDTNFLILEPTNVVGIRGVGR